MTNFTSITERNKFKHILKEFFKVISFFLLLLAGAAFLTNLHLPSKQTYTCDMEHVVQWKNAPFFECKGRYFANAHLQTTEKVHSGNFSVKTGLGNTYAAVHKYTNLTGYELVTITAWRYNETGKNGQIVINVPNNILWQSGSEIVESTNDGWEKIQLTHQIPRNAENKNLTIYLWNSSKQVVYFDDLIVEIKQ